MIEEFWVDNFKTLVNFSFRPKKQNLLLGTNNSGKTNLCHALRFLSLSARFPFDQVAAALGGSATVCTHGADRLTFRVVCTLPFDDDHLRFEYHLALSSGGPAQTPFPAELRLEEEKLVASGPTLKDPLTLLSNRQGHVRLLHEKRFLSDQYASDSYVETTAPTQASMLSRLYDLQTNRQANHFKKYLSTWQYYDLSTTLMRSSTALTDNLILNIDGSNLASVIYRLKTENERAYRDFVETAKKIEPTLEYINFKVIEETKAVFMFLQHAKGETIPAQNASNGTIRYLGLLYILLVAPTNQQSLVMIDEPENAIYVGLLKHLVGLSKELGEGHQIVFVSHSPYFIDLFDDILESVFVLKRPGSHSTIQTLDIESVRRRLNDFPLGEQHYHEMLG